MQTQACPILSFVTLIDEDSLRTFWGYVKTDPVKTRNGLPETGVCKYCIGPIGNLYLLTATAAAAARIHSLHRVIKIKFQK